MKVWFLDIYVTNAPNNFELLVSTNFTGMEH